MQRHYQDKKKFKNQGGIEIMIFFSNKDDSFDSR